MKTIFSFPQKALFTLALFFGVLLLTACASKQGQQSDQNDNYSEQQAYDGNLENYGNQLNGDEISSNQNYGNEYGANSGDDAANNSVNGNYNGNAAGVNNYANATEDGLLNGATYGNEYASENYSGGNEYQATGAFGEGEDYLSLNNSASEPPLAEDIAPISNPAINNQGNYPNGFGAGNQNLSYKNMGVAAGTPSDQTQLTQTAGTDGNIPANGIVRPSEAELRYYVPSYDLMPNKSMLWWVGFNFPQKSNKARVEMVTRGAPKYDVLLEKNQIDQPEIVVRFYDTGLRRKVRRDIDTSEFRSPVAFIRARVNEDKEAVDVIITMRDMVTPRMYARNGNILLTFDIPAKYMVPDEVEVAPTSKAELIASASFSPTMLSGSDRSKSQFYQAYIPDPTEGAFASKADAQDGEIVTLEATHLGGEPKTIERTPNYQNTAPVVTPNAQPAVSQGPNYSNVLQEFESNGVQAPRPPAVMVQPRPLAPQAPVMIGPPTPVMMAPPTAQGVGDGFPAQPVDPGLLEDDRNPIDPNEFEDENLDDFNDETIYDDEKFDVRNDYHISSYAISHVAQYDGDFENVFNEGENPYTGGDVANVEAAADDMGAAPAPALAPAPAAEQYANPYPDPYAANQAMPQNIGPQNDPQDMYGQDMAVQPTNDGGYPPVEVIFSNAKLQTVLYVLGEENSVNFTFNGDIGEKIVNVSFKNVSWDHALRAVLETHNLGLVKLEGNIYRIDELRKLNMEKEELIKIQKNADLLEPTKIKVFRLSYAQAKNLKGLAEGLLSSKDFDKRIKVEVEERTNSLVVEGTANDLAKIEGLISRVDMQTPQVEIASRIVEVLEVDRSSLGIDWNGPLNIDQGRGLGFGSLVFPNNMVSAWAIDSGAETNGGASGINARFGSVNNSFELDMKLRMQEVQGKTKIVQNPSILAEDNTKAIINAGQQDFVPMRNPETNQMEVRTIDYLLQLEVTPHITIDGAVRMEVKIENAAPIEGIAQGSLGARSQRFLETSLLQENGETKAIGGLYATDQKTQVSGIPFLSKIPIIGALFRTTTRQSDRREMILLLTPTIVNGRKAMSDGAASTTSTGEYSNVSNTAASNYSNISNDYSNDVSEVNSQLNSSDDEYGEYDDSENSEYQEEYDDEGNSSDDDDYGY